MDNAEQNKIIMAAVEKVLAAREEAAAAMKDVLISHMEVKVAVGRKKVIKVGTLYGFNAEENVMIVKLGRSVDEVPIERLLEIVEPMAFEVPEDDDELPENAVYLDGESHDEEPPFGHVSEFDTN